MFPVLGLYLIDPDTSVTINKNDVYTAYRGGNTTSPEWIFETTSGFRIQFEFEQFTFYWSTSYYSALEIGDGVTRGAETRLVHFRGLDKPSDVTSVSNAAWMRVYAPYNFRN